VWNPRSGLSSATCIVSAKLRMNSLPNWLILTLIGFENCVRIDEEESEVDARR